MKKIVWCRRDLIRSAYYGLCIDERSFMLELKRLKVPRKEWPEFVSEGANATCHFFENARSRTAIVCLRGHKGRSATEIYGLLIHEAVHIWQDECRAMREKNPGSEIEAYAIQSVSQNLIEAYQRLA